MDSPLDYDQLINDELDKWKLIGIHDPASVVSSNSFLDGIKIMSISNLLKEKGLITQEELDLSFKKQMLEALQEARKGVNSVRMEQITKGIIN